MDTENKDATKKIASSTSTKPRKRRSAKAADSNRKSPSRKPAEQRAVKTDNPDYQRPTKTLYWVRFFNEWCKSCGICAALCPQNIILFDNHGYPRVQNMDDCIGCRICEIHCPDFAITIKKRHPERRKSDGRR